jgi:preprotein translocase subunit SecA
MGRQEVLDSLKYFSKDFPKAAFREVQANRMDFTSDLLESLDHAYKNAAELYKERSNYHLHTYAMYLLAEFREKRAFPYLVALLKLPEDQVYFLLGDILTEDFHRILLCTYDNENLQMLYDIIENEELDEYARNAAVKAYALLYKEGFVAQEEIILYFRGLIEKLSIEDFVLTSIVSSVIDTHLVEMIPDVRQLYEDERVDIFVNGDYDKFLEWINKEDQRKMPTYINDAVDELEHWACYNQSPTKKNSEKSTYDFGAPIINEVKKDHKQAQKIMPNHKQTQKPMQKQKKPARNAPCPCGSGRKYKKCCGANLRK